jgi:drug/metabolite transporter (DMT)-like permease
MSTYKGTFFALIAFAIFSTHDVVIKSLGTDYAPFQLIFFSTLLSFPLVTFMLMRDAEPGTLRPVHPWWTALRTVSGVVGGFSVFYAFSALPLAQVYAILFASPLLITILSIPILGETVRLRRWAAVIVGLIGVLVVLRPGTAELTLGHGAALVGAITSAFASIVVRKIGQEERPIVLLLYPMAANFVIMAAILAFVYKPMPIEDLGQIGIVSILGFVAGLFLIAAYKFSEAAIVAPMQYSQIIWASIFGWFIFGETLDRYTVIGACIIISSGMYIVLRESRGGSSQNTPVLRTRSRPEMSTSFRISTFLPRSMRGKPAPKP